MTERDAGGVRGRSAVLFVCIAAFGGTLFLGGLWFTGDARKSLVQDASLSLSPKEYLQVRPLDAIALASQAAGMPAATARPLETSASWLAPLDPLITLQRAQRATAESNTTESIRLWLSVAVLAPENRREAFSQLARLAATPEWGIEYPVALKAGWAASSEFVLHVCASQATAATVLSLAFETLKHRPLSNTAVNCVTNKAIAAGLALEARWFWINSFPKLPATIGNVFDGSFDRTPTGNPFDWTFGTGGEFRAGFSTSIVPESTRGESKSALSVRFNGRSVQYPVAQQTLALIPGKYTLRYLAREAGFPAPSNVSWMVRCAGAEAIALTQPLEQRVVDTGWTTRSAGFIVPANCTGQILRLELGSRLDLLQGLNGTLYFDEITVSRD